MIIFVLAFIFGCKQKDANIALYQKMIECEKLTQNYKALFIIPSVGCQGCISSAEAFVKRNMDKCND